MAQLALDVAKTPDVAKTDVPSDETNELKVGTAEGQSRRIGTWATSIALIAAMLQLPVGIWLLAVLPSSEQSRILGSDLWATGLLALAFFSAVPF